MSATTFVTLTLHKPPGAKLGVQLKSVEGAADPAPHVVLVRSGSAADKADLREGDIVVAIGGEEVRSHEQALALLKAASGSVEVRVRRRVASVAVAQLGFEDGSLDLSLMSAEEIALRHRAATTHVNSGVPPPHSGVPSPLGCGTRRRRPRSQTVFLPPPPPGYRQCAAHSSHRRFT